MSWKVWQSLISWRGWPVPECPGEARQYMNVLERLGSTWMSWRGWAVPECSGEAGQYLYVLERLGSTWMSWRGWAVPECPGEAGQYLDVLRSWAVLNILNRLGSIECPGEAGQYLNAPERLGSTWMSWRGWTVPERPGETGQYLNVLLLERLGSTWMPWRGEAEECCPRWYRILRWGRGSCSRGHTSHLSIEPPILRINAF
jgi:hypothetical protein